LNPPASTQWHRESNVVFDEEVAAMDRWRDPDSGVLKLRLTSLPFVDTHIYPETPVSSLDGKRFVWRRVDPYANSSGGGSGVGHYWIAEIDTLRIRQITDEPDAGCPLYTPNGDAMFYSVGRAIVRMDPATFERQRLCEIPETFGVMGAIRTISADGRRALFSVRGGVGAVDLHSGEARIAFTRDDCVNAHAQYCRQPGSRLVSIQVNDGAEFDADDNMTRLVGDNGASLWVANDDGTNATRLNVGGSPLEHVQGHQCWLGQTTRKITTLHRRDRADQPWVQDRIVTIGPDDEHYDIVGEGEGFTHIHTTRDGRYWVSDCNRTARVFVGSVKTGRYRLFVNTGATFGSHQSTHPHPFFLGDDRAIGWNSDETGVAQVYVARIPDGFLDSLA